MRQRSSAAVLALVATLVAPPLGDEEFEIGIVSPPWLLPAKVGGLADGFYDLYTLASHEVAHALGFSSGWGNFAANVVPAPVPQVQWVARPGASASRRSRSARSSTSA